MVFEHDLPTRVIFGAGRLDELGTVTSDYGRRALIVCGRSAMRKHGVLGRASAALDASDVATTIFDDISANPRSDEIDTAAELARTRGCDVVVGIGGGSALDAAKAVAVSITHPTVRGLVGTTVSANPDALPIIAVPTTAGTGSEVSRGAIVIDVERRFKSGIRGPDLFPKVAIVDPELTASLPRPVTLETGFDALTHVIESYVARGATPLSDALALRAASLLGDNLARLANDDVTADVREQMSLAALLGGMNVATASTCLPHRLQQAMGSETRVQLSHGRGLAIVYPAWVRRAQPFAEARFAQIAERLGHRSIEVAIDDLLQALGLSSTLSAAGYRPDDIDTFVLSVSGNLANDPMAAVDRQLVRTIFEESFS